jgi:FAD/FMN-containing dehydrogenase
VSGAPVDRRAFLRWSGSGLALSALGAGSGLLAACGGPVHRETRGSTAPGRTGAGLTTTGPTTTGPTTTGPTTTGPTTAGPTTVPETTGSAPPTAAEWSTLAASLQGPLIRPGDARYPLAVQLYDSRYDDRHPAAVAYAASTEDVARSLAFARAHDLAPIPRSGGHSYAGYSTGDGLVIDVTSLSGVTTPTAGTASVGAGTRLIDLYSALNASGVSVPGGSCPTVGIAGLALGGGAGVVDRRFGMTCDQVTGLQVVTADGRVVLADPGTNPDLYWACRGGGGGNYGIVTSFTFATFATADVTVFGLTWPWAAASQVLPAWLAWAPPAPDDLWSNLLLQTDPDAAAPTVIVGGVWQGTAADLDPLLTSLTTATGVPSGRYRETVPFSHAMYLEGGCARLGQAACHLPDQSSTGATFLGAASATSGTGTLPRSPSLAKSDYLVGPLGDAGVAAVLAGIDARRQDGGAGAVGYDAYGGAINRVAAGATAFVHRDTIASAQYNVPFTPTTSATDLSVGQAWLDAWYASLRPYVSGAAYQNYIDPDLVGWAEAYYGTNLPRLRSIKATWDPDDVFRFAQSIPLH